jgi:ADP-ribosylglycohydrolase
MSSALEKAVKSLEGLSLGDAFGEQFFNPAALELIRARRIPAGIWEWTDDTAMAISLVEVLRDCGEIDQDLLSQHFAQRYSLEPNRGYGSGAHFLLARLIKPGDWKHLAPKLFNGGSFGNGAAMRVAPLGGYFSDDPERAAFEARKSALVTHYHEEGQAGAIAVAVAASLAGSGRHYSSPDFLSAVLEYVPPGIVREKTEEAGTIPGGNTAEAIRKLGTGLQVSAQDTVPWCLWSAANNLYNYEEALWQTVSGLGDCDTTCAIVGGIVALSAESLPGEWLKRRESLPVM